MSVRNYISYKYTGYSYVGVEYVGVGKATGDEADGFTSCRICFGAVSEARTRDPQLGKLMLYQLSYYRVCRAKLYIILQFSKFYQFFLLNLRCILFAFSFR